MLVRNGTNVRIEQPLDSTDNGKFPRLKIRDETGVFVANVDLSHMNGTDAIYEGTFAVPASGLRWYGDLTVFVDNQYEVVDFYPRIEFVFESTRLIAEAVRDVSINGSAPASLGGHIRLLAAISAFSNIRVDNIVYNENGFMTSARIRTFEDSTAAQASTAGGTNEGETETIVITGSPHVVFVTLLSTMLGLRT